MDLQSSSTVRDAELSELLHRTATHAGSVVIRASAGMGKSTLLRALFDELSRQDVTVRFVRPTEAEQQMPFTALVDILAGLPERWYNSLPAPQRRAIRGALLLDEVDDEIDPRAVAAGIAGVVEVSGYQRPIVIIVDDAQWLDPASRAMIVAGLRRIRTRPITLIAATRPTEQPIDGWLPGDVHVLDLDPLGRDQMQRLLRTHLGNDRGPAVLRSVVERSGGNPLFALQLARNHAHHEGRLDQLISRQVLALPLGTRRVLLTAALAVDRSLDTIAQALQLTPLELCERIDPARVSGVVTTGQAVRFEHPLYAEAVVALAADPERRRALAGLALAEPDADTRVAHRAAVTTGTDDELATQLEEAAHNARRRGAWDRSAELLAQAADHTTPGLARQHRQRILAEWLIRGGRSAEGEALLRDLRRDATGDTHHRATLALAELLLFTGRGREAGELVAGLQESDADPQVRAEALLLNPLMVGDRQMLARAERAERILADAAPSPAVERVRTAALTLRARCLISAAEPAEDVLAAAVEREGEAPSYAPLQSAAMLAASDAHWGERHDDAERGYRILIEQALDAGDEESLPTLLAYAACSNIRRGRWQEARRDLDAAFGADAQHQAGAPVLANANAWMRGHAGDVEAAVAEFERTAPVLDRLGPGLAMYNRSWRGEVLLGAERYDEALVALREGLALRRASDTADPGLLPLDTDFAEAAIALGDLDAAERRLSTAADRAKRMGRDSVTAGCERVRLLLLAVRGDLDAATAGIPAMLEAYDATHRRPLDRGRAHLAAAEVLRRARSRRGAHEQLALAQAVFAASGHETFRRRAEHAAARLGARRGGPADLTGTELRTAQLAAAGMRNKEIAAALFVDLKTVESTLTRVYRKLGIRSRVELVRTVAPADAPVPAGR